MINPMDLTGKQILVAGATSEIGKVIVTQIGQLGANVVMIDNDEEKLKSFHFSLDKNIYNYYYFDIFNNKEIESHIRQIVKLYGSFHGFVYCAGIGGVRPLSLTRYENMLTMMNANCFSFVEMARCITRKNSFSDGGSIVSISSVSSIKGLKSKMAYSSSKAALDSAVRSLAAELADKGIRVNSILKGGLSTDNNMDYIKNIVELNNNETIKKQILGEIEPAEVANLVAFLLSDSVKTITGTSILLDSGYTL